MRESDEHGRIGYGRLGRYTPFAFALLIVGALLAMSLNELRPEDATSDDATSSAISTPQVGDAAPDVTLNRFDGSTLRLADLRGSVVVVNFWASWCAPCEEEIPALQAVSDDPPDLAVPVQIVGVAGKADQEDNARAFAERLGMRYPAGRDTGGQPGPNGEIHAAFDLIGWLPATIFIAPDGTIAAVVYGELAEAEIRAYVEEAATTDTSAANGGNDG